MGFLRGPLSCALVRPPPSRTDDVDDRRKDIIYPSRGQDRSRVMATAFIERSQLLWLHQAEDQEVLFRQNGGLVHE